MPNKVNYRIIYPQNCVAYIFYEQHIYPKDCSIPPFLQFYFI